MLLQGWGRYPSQDAVVSQPLSKSAAVEIVLHAPAVIGRGMGRSYGDSALAPSVVSTAALTHMQSFDAVNGVLVCQAGVSLAQILEVFVPRGWFLPVTPGTRFVSVGGAIASDVHGKNHHLYGCFSECLDQFDLLLGDGRILTCSRNENAELFRATCGGMGLTGLILSATLRLMRIQSSFIDQTTYRAANLEVALELFESHRQATYSVAWIDCLAKGRALGRSLLMMGEHALDGGLCMPTKRRLTVPVDMPSVLLNQYSISAFNALYYRRAWQACSRQHVDYESFFYPLDSINQWNRLYGRKGFLQYQFVIPKEAGLSGMSAILERIAESGRGSFLAVLKVFGSENRNFLSFPMEGYTLALDFKMEAALFPLLNELDAMVLDHGGRLYLTKDARMSASTFQQGYPRWQEFQDVRRSCGACGKFSSAQSRRIGLD